MGIPTRQLHADPDGRGRESLVYEVEVLRARVKQLEAETTRITADRDAALDALHALEEWVDAVGDVFRMGFFHARQEREEAVSQDGGGMEFDYWTGVENCYETAIETLEGGWDATAGEE